MAYCWSGARRDSASHSGAMLQGSWAQIEASRQLSRPQMMLPQCRSKGRARRTMLLWARRWLAASLTATT
jgi:hypothetical protein